MCCDFPTSLMLQANFNTDTHGPEDLLHLFTSHATKVINQYDSADTVFVEEEVVDKNSKDNFLRNSPRRNGEVS